MSNTSVVNDLVRPLRRSTRLNAIVPITVMGVDSYRGPYREDVSTVTVNAMAASTNPSTTCLPIPG